jgi:hypothetical protein
MVADFVPPAPPEPPASVLVVASMTPERLHPVKATKLAAQRSESICFMILGRLN